MADMASSKIDPQHQLAIFIDVDGTILADSQEIAPSTITAIRTARAKGHLVFLSTGRSPVHVPTNVAAIGFDGMVGSGGAIAVVNDEIVLLNAFTPAEQQWMVDYFDERGIHWVAETTSHMFASTGLAEVMQPIWESRTDIEFPKYEPAAELGAGDMIKVVVVSDDKERIETAFSELAEKFHAVTGTIPMPFGASCEFTPAGVNKGSTITELLQVLDIPKERTIAIGDNWNDIEMFEACGLAIAMGNSDPGVKEHADEVTTDVLDDGIYNALHRHHII